MKIFGKRIFHSHHWLYSHPEYYTARAAGQNPYKVNKMSIRTCWCRQREWLERTDGGFEYWRRIKDVTPKELGHDHRCEIHGDTFSMDEEGGCPSCMSEWVDLEPEEELDWTVRDPSELTDAP